MRTVLCMILFCSLGTVYSVLLLYVFRHTNQGQYRIDTVSVGTGLQRSDDETAEIKVTEARHLYYKEIARKNYSSRDGQVVVLIPKVQLGTWPLIAGSQPFDRRP